MKIIIIGIFFCVVLFLSGNVFAESGDVADGQAEFKAMDVDNNNSGAMEEFQVYEKNNFDNLDTNKDGVLDVEELKADTKGVFKGADKNNDGQVTWEEASGSFSDYFKQIDTDNNNSVDAKEYDEYWKNRIQF